MISDGPRRRSIVLAGRPRPVVPAQWARGQPRDRARRARHRPSQSPHGRSHRGHAAGARSSFPPHQRRSLDPGDATSRGQSRARDLPLGGGGRGNDRRARLPRRSHHRDRRGEARRSRGVPFPDQPWHSVPDFVQGLTGIAPKMLRDAPSFDAVVDDLLHVFSGSVFVAHNARFDWAVVTTEIERATGLLLQGPRVCTVRLARKLLPDLPRRNLDTGSYHFGIEIEGRHRATGDAVAAARCLAKLIRLAQGNGATTLLTYTTFRVGRLTCHALEGGR